MYHNLTLVSKVAVVVIGKEVGSYLEDFQFGVGVPNGSEAILHAVNRLVEAKGEVSSMSMLLVDFSNAFNLIDRSTMLREVQRRCPSLSPWVEFCFVRPARLYYEGSVLLSSQGVQQGDPLGPLLFALTLHPLIHLINEKCNLDFMAWYLDDGTIIGETALVSSALQVITTEGPAMGLHLNVEKTEIFWPTPDRRSYDSTLFPPSIAHPRDGVQLLGGPVSLKADFCSRLIEDRVAKAVGLMEAVAELNDPQSELLLLRCCVGVSRLYFSLRTCLPHMLGSAPFSIDLALRRVLQDIIVDGSAGFGDWQWRCATLPFRLGGVGGYFSRSYKGGWHAAAGVVVKKEVPLGFLSEEGRDLRPADLLVYSWDKGKNVCLDVTGISPFTGPGVDAFAPGLLSLMLLPGRRRSMKRNA
ncbi:uncharacterized protein [Spinacia oleracea]|uniref:Reverse transcriptase domain-containing protein n=1 Tax=Spinacia oleracea TaxID=3562 RepID=A0ABM3QRL7_SPIOL|nr:uncharacterized protein LOC130461803 [Spinacia oleracea]